MTAKLLCNHSLGEGDITAEKADYDLLEGCTVRFNDDPTYPVNDTIRYLQLLLTDIAPPLERLNELHDKYGLSKTREAEDMCNYSEYLIERGVKKGQQEGLEQGIEQGIEKGIEQKELDFLKQLEAEVAPKNWTDC